MAERKRSADGRKDSERVLGASGQVSQQGRSGGQLPRDVATRDELKRAEERPAGATRVRKSDEKAPGS